MSKYTASEVIQLPRLTAVGAMALGEQLLTAAKRRGTADWSRCPSCDFCGNR